MLFQGAIMLHFSKLFLSLFNKLLLIYSFQVLTLATIRIKQLKFLRIPHAFGHIRMQAWGGGKKECKLILEHCFGLLYKRCAKFFHIPYMKVDVWFCDHSAGWIKSHVLPELRPMLFPVLRQLLNNFFIYQLWLLWEAHREMIVTLDKS